MQGLWAMAFRGPKASIQKLDAAVQALGENETYKYVVKDWCRASSLSEDLGSLADTDEVTLRVDTGSSCNISGMTEIFMRFVKLASELEAAYCENSLDTNGFKSILYTKAGSTRKVTLSAIYERQGTEISMAECEYDYCEQDDEEDSEDDWELSPKDAARLAADFHNGYLEPSSFEFTYCGITYNASDGRYVEQYGEWYWVLENGPGHWEIDKPKYNFVLELLGLE